MNSITEHFVLKVAEAKTSDEKLTALCELVCNHLVHKVYWSDMKLNFVLGMLGTILALLSISLIIR